MFSHPGDFTKEARFLAMAVRDTGQRFGIQVPIQVVKGESTKLLSRYVVTEEDSFISFDCVTWVVFGCPIDVSFCGRSTTVFCQSRV